MFKKKIFAILICISLLFISVAPTMVSAFDSNKSRIVRVGYFQSDGYHNGGETSEKSGYGYEYLQEMKKYADWTYDYVYAKTFDDALKLLETDKIDLLTSAAYKAERESYASYSKNSIGTKTSILTVKSTNDKYFLGEYEDFDGIKVGILNGDTNITALDDFSKENNFTYTVVDTFGDIDELWSALQKKDVEAIMTTNLRRTNNERVIGEFNPAPYYAMVRKDNPDLLAELDTAIERIKIETPIYENQLYEKYYGSDITGDIAFSAMEQEYIKNNNTVNILLPPSIEPLIKVGKDGLTGVVPEIIKKALEKTGLKLNMVMANTVQEYLAKKSDTDTYPILGLVNEDIYEAEMEQFRLTSSYINLSYNIVTRAGKSPKNPIIAAVKGAIVTKNYVEKHYMPEQIKYYDSEQKCVDALVKGEATHIVMNSFNAEYTVEKDVINNFVSNSIMSYSSNLALSVSDDADLLLFSILNKSVNALSKADVRAIIVENTLVKDRRFSLIEYIYMNPGTVMISTASVFTIIIATVVILTRRDKIKKQKLAFEETSQFAKIAMETNSAISEYNFNAHCITFYSFKDNKLIKNEDKLSKEIMYETTLQKVHPEFLEDYEEVFSEKSLSEICGSDKQKSCTLRLKGDNGEYNWWYFVLNGIRKTSLHPNNVMIFQKNVEDLKAKEEQRRQQLIDALNSANLASEAKSAFMSRMSHEIRTPLNAVIGYMTIAKNNTSNTNKVKDCVSKCEIAGKHLLSIINEVLDTSAIESGKLKIAHAEFNFKELISEISSLFYTQAKAKGITFEVLTKEVTEDFLIGDKLRVNQILMNLLSNAVKFTPDKGKIFFIVEQTAIKDNKVFMKFIIEDSGIGMTEEFSQKIFTPFEQQDASTAAKFGGTGLGLSITKNLTTMMNGVISVKSFYGEGTTFTVELPFGKDLTKVNIQETINNFSRIKVLIVDDEQAACEYMHILMERCGVTSEYALSGQLAIDKVVSAKESEKPFDMCLMDWQMPDMNGVETVKKIRQLVGKEMPIIIVTAYDFSEIEQTANAAGVSLFVSKPLFQSTMFDLLVNTYGKYTVKAPEEKVIIDNFKGKKLLLVEDNEMNREIAKEILSEYDFIIDTAENGQEALDIMKSDKAGEYSAILMDIQMPIMNGHDACRAIRSLPNKKIKKLPIIAMTANAFTEDIAAAHASGMNDHIAKPIDIEQMLATLRKYI